VFGNYSVRAKEEAEAQKLIDDAKALEAAGCFAIVVEKIPATLTQKVMQQVNIPIIGIGGGQADGQVLVVDDLLGKNPGFKPKFLRQYADLHTIMTNAINQYVADVKSTDFPNVNEQY
jgi:3-methyl-2-oxobutanoate hydroxymethyltransferase